MVTKRMRSEYMKKFKDPKWDTYSKCYEEMLRHRLTRRLLEQTHNPWFWSGSDSDSDSGLSATPPNKSRERSETTKDRAEAEREACEGVSTDRPQEETIALVPKIALPEEDEDESPPISALHGAGEAAVPEEGKVERRARSRGRKRSTPPLREPDGESVPGAPLPQQSSKLRWRAPGVRPAALRKPREDNKESTHPPFALYGSGEKHAETARMKTHNVGPAAFTKEIHESALRAKTRREVERQVQTQRAERRRAKRADLPKTRAQPTQPAFNPWLTEYMRCFAARSR